MPSIVQILRDLRIVQSWGLQVHIPHIGTHTNHVGHSFLVSKPFHDISSLGIANVSPDNLKSLAYPESKGNQNSGSPSLNDELRVVELQIVVKNNLGGEVDTVQAVVTEQQDIQLQVSSLLLGFDIRQAALKYI